MSKISQIAYTFAFLEEISSEQNALGESWYAASFAYHSG